MTKEIALYLGSAASWITIFSFINGVASKNTRTRITDFFLSISDGKAKWSPLFLSFFDQLFGFPISFIKSIIATILGFLLLSISAFYLGKVDFKYLLHLVVTAIIFFVITLIAQKIASLKFFRFSGVGYNSAKAIALSMISIPIYLFTYLIFFCVYFSVGGAMDFSIVKMVFFFLSVNVVADFFALNQTRYFLDLHVSSKLVTFNMVTLDLLAKLGIFMASVIFTSISLIYVSRLPGNPTIGIGPEHFHIVDEIISIFIGQENSNRHLIVVLAISLYTTLIATAWLWIFLFGRFLFSGLRRTQFLFRMIISHTESKQSITLFGIVTAPFVLAIIALFNSLT